MSAVQIRHLEKMMENFLWNGKRSKIPLKVLQRSKARGGLRLFDIRARQCALKAKWVRQICCKPSEYDYIYNWLNVHYNDNIWNSNLKTTDIVMLFEDSFWRTVLVEWSCIHFQSNYVGSEVLEVPLWYNSCVRIDNRPVFFKKAFNSGVYKFGDILDGYYNVYTYRQFCENYGTCMTWLEYGQLKKAIPRQWFTLVHENHEVQNVELSDFIICKNPTRYVYNKYIYEHGSSYMDNYYKYFTECVYPLQFEDYLLAFRYIPKITGVTSLRTFQYRCLLGKIFTRTTLFKWNIVSNTECTACAAIHTIKHLFWDCPRSVCIWKMVAELVNNEYVLTYYTVSICKPAAHGHILNLMVLVAKYYLYACFCKGTSCTVGGFLQQLKYIKSLDKYNARSEKEKKIIDSKWKGVTL